MCVGTCMLQFCSISNPAIASRTFWLLSTNGIRRENMQSTPHIECSGFRFAKSVLLLACLLLQPFAICCGIPMHHWFPLTFLLVSSIHQTGQQIVCIERYSLPTSVADDAAQYKAAKQYQQSNNPESIINRPPANALSAVENCIFWARKTNSPRIDVSELAKCDFGGHAGANGCTYIQIYIIYYLGGEVGTGQELPFNDRNYHSFRVICVSSMHTHTHCSNAQHMHTHSPHLSSCASSHFNWLTFYDWSIFRIKITWISI